VPAVLDRWILAQGDANLIVYGGDVYNVGSEAEYAVFAGQIGGDLTLRCQVPGNHDWMTSEESAASGRIPAGYERFWSRHTPPASRQPIDTAKKGGARYEHWIDLDGWRLIFVDTGLAEHSPWPVGDDERLAWLRAALRGTPGRAKLLFSHFSRLSYGLHGDSPGVDRLWRELFDEHGAPLAVCMIAGHDHNVSLYGPRPRNHPGAGSVPFERGIHLMVNGAGGAGHYHPHVGTRPDLLAESDGFCVSRITLTRGHSARFEILNFGAAPDVGEQPSVLGGFEVQLEPG